MLHIIHQSPFTSEAFDTAVKIATPDDWILLIEDGVWSAVSQTDISHQTEEALKNFKICALQADMEKRMLLDKLIKGIELTDYDGFVGLVEEHVPIGW